MSWAYGRPFAVKNTSQTREKVEWIAKEALLE